MTLDLSLECPACRGPLPDSTEAAQRLEAAADAIRLKVAAGRRLTGLLPWRMLPEPEQRLWVDVAAAGMEAASNV